SSRRRHTRWPRDWSSDVCSSDLAVLVERSGERIGHRRRCGRGGRRRRGVVVAASGREENEQKRDKFTADTSVHGGLLELPFTIRSEERRVGKECGYRCGAESYD